MTPSTPYSSGEGGLLPCPFCGAKDQSLAGIRQHTLTVAQVVKPEATGFLPYWAVQCEGCVSEGPPTDTKASAIAAWNTRVVSPGLPVGEDQGSFSQGAKIPTEGHDAAVLDNDGYKVAFYEMAEMLGLPAMPLSPAEVWRSFMRPMLWKRTEGGWRSMDTAPRDQVIIAMARYRDATAGSPAFVTFIDGEWRELGRTIMEPMVCWAWMTRDVLGDWPSENRKLGGDEGEAEVHQNPAQQEQANDRR